MSHALPDKLRLHACHVQQFRGDVRVMPVAASDVVNEVADDFLADTSVEVEVRLSGGCLVLLDKRSGSATAELLRVPLWLSDVRRVGRAGVAVEIPAVPAERCDAAPAIQDPPRPPSPSDGFRGFRRKAMASLVMQSEEAAAGKEVAGNEAAATATTAAFSPAEAGQCASPSSSASSSGGQASVGRTEGPERLPPAAAASWIFLANGGDAAQRVLAAFGLHGAIRSDFKQEYVLESARLGSGVTADVFWATSTYGRCGIAAKCYKFGRAAVSDATLSSSLEKEVQMLVALQGHPNILKFYGLFRRSASSEESSDIQAPASCLAMELCASDLASAPRRQNPEEFARPLMRDVLSGLKHIHSLGFVHRDVKPPNIMLRRDGTAVLADFGIACCVHDEEAIMKSRGSPGFCAPEIIRKRGCCLKSDVWSLGATLYWLICRELPFGGADTKAVLRNIVVGQLKGDHPEFHRSSRTCQEYIRLLLAKDPAIRLSAGSAMEHHWIRQPAVRGGVLPRLPQTQPPHLKVGSDAPLPCDNDVLASEGAWEEDIRGSWPSRSSDASRRPTRGSKAIAAAIASVLSPGTAMKGARSSRSTTGAITGATVCAEGAPATSLSFSSTNPGRWSGWSFRRHTAPSRHAVDGAGGAAPPPGQETAAASCCGDTPPSLGSDSGALAKRLLRHRWQQINGARRGLGTHSSVEALDEESLPSLPMERDAVADPADGDADFDMERFPVQPAHRRLAQYRRRSATRPPTDERVTCRYAALAD